MVPDEAHLGPAMLALTPLQRGFVIALVETGGKSDAGAARLAGYGGTDASCWQAGHRLAHNPKVQLAIREEADRRLRAGALLGASALIEIASDIMHKDRYKAAESLLNRAGLLVETQHRVIVEDDRRTEQEIVAAITLMAKRNNLDPRKLLGYDVKDVAVEGEFTEVDDAAPSADGLEDLL